MEVNSNNYKQSFFLPRKGLQGKILTPVLAVVLIMIGLMLAIYSWMHVSTGKDLAAKMLSLAADSYKDEIQRWLLRREGEAKITAANPLFREALTRIVSGQPGAGRDREILTAFLHEMLLNFPHYEEIYFVDRGGRIFLSTDARRVGQMRPRDELVRRPLEDGGVYFQDAYLSYATRQPCIAFAVAVEGWGEGADRFPDRRVGVLVFRVKTEDVLHSVRRGEAWLGATGEVVLLRGDRVVLTDLRRRPGSSLSFRSSARVAQLAVQGEEGIMETRDYAGVPVLAAYRRIPFTGWGMVVKQDLAEIMVPIWRGAGMVALVGLAGVSLIFLLVVAVVNRALQPLQEVGRAAAALARGRLDQRVAVTGTEDEIGLVGRAFNEMAAGLEAQFKVQDRLQQLLRVVISTIRMQPLLAAALETLARAYGFHVGAVYLARPEQGVFERLAAYCPAGELLGQVEVDLKEGPLGQVLAGRQPLLQEDIPPESVYTVQTLAGAVLPAAVVYLPLVFRDEVLGVAVLGSLRAPDKPVLEELQTAAGLLAVAVNNARAFEQVTELSQQLAQLNEELTAQNEELQMQAEELQTQAEELQAQAEEIETQSKELAELNRQLEEASRMKSEFLAKMSHELRTPLNAVIGFSELLLEGLFGPLNEKQREYVGDILASGRHLLTLINDILDLSKVEAGQLEFNPVPVDPARPLQEALSLIGADARRKEHTLQVELASGRYTVRADPARLKQIFLNLLSNAVKFTPAGGTITIRATPGEEELTLHVTDTGIGIAPEFHQIIFEEFRQGKVDPSRRHEGTGLGLAITRKLVDMHGGRIWVTSRPGEGATFSFTLPLVAQSRVDLSPDGSTPARTGVEDRPVLLVEDDRAAAGFLAALLTEKGYRVYTATSGEEALQVVEELRPWVIILDIMLPGRDGWEVLAELKSRATTRDIPVIIVSALDETGRGLALGAVDYFVKPVDRDLLLSRLRSLELWCETGLPAVLVVDDEPRVVEYLTAVLQSAGYRVYQAFGGREAITMALAEKPDVLLLDLVMPDMTGFDVVDELSRRPECAAIRIFILTARDLTASEKRRLEERVAAIARKGQLSREQFLARLEAVAWRKDGKKS